MSNYEQGLQQSADRTYLRVSAGKLRLKSDESDSTAVKRTFTIGGTSTTVWEKVYGSLIAKLKDVSFHTHAEYGNSWTIIAETSDGTEYGLQMSENGRYCTDFLKMLPNMKFGTIYKFTPYEFENNGKSKIGFSIKECSLDKAGKVIAGDSVANYYQDFTQDKNGKWIITNKHKFPEFDGDSSDKEELKIYFIRVTKFLRTMTEKFLEKAKVEAAKEPIATSPDVPEDNIDNDDLPF